jgi:hypothetical protein
MTFTVACIRKYLPALSQRSLRVPAARHPLHLLNHPPQPVALTLAQDVSDLRIHLRSLHPQRHIAYDENVEHDPERPDVLLRGPSGANDVVPDVRNAPGPVPGDVALRYTLAQPLLVAVGGPQPDRPSRRDRPPTKQPSPTTRRRRC